MPQTLIIYDEGGYIISKSSGHPIPREPVGVPFLWVDVPKGKYLKNIGEIGIDVSVTPHVPILEDIPPSEVDILREKMSQQENALVELAELIAEVLG